MNELRSSQSTSAYVSTTNACKLCKPMGACLAFRGIEGAVPFLHGSQGCATYMRRYIISHFREPMDIASSSLGEKHAVYGGEANLKQGLSNVMGKYGAQIIGVATTCLTETIGDDVSMIVRSFREEVERSRSGTRRSGKSIEAAAESRPMPLLVSVSTPSYSGSHMEGFHAAVRAVVDQVCDLDARPTESVNVLPGFLSPADIRHLQEVLEDMGLSAIVLPDISETLDGPAMEDYEKIPFGGTPLSGIRSMSGSKATIQLGRTIFGDRTAGRLLSERHGVSLFELGTPIGLRETNDFFDALGELSRHEIPRKHVMERGRLIDAFVDAHKYLFDKRAVIYGEEDLVVGLTSFMAEIGIKPVLCASGGRSGRFRAAIEHVTEGILSEPPVVREGADFYDIAEETESLAPDLLIGHSKGYHLAKRLHIPLIRVGFPIHDRFGGHRILHIGYRGAQMLLDQIVNALLEKKQESSAIGYGYM